MLRTFSAFFIAGLLSTTAAYAFLGCEEPPVWDPKMIETALKKFYNNTKGDQWPPAWKSPRWTSDMPCAWDGNERAHPAPPGTRCLNGGWHKFPPAADGGLLFIEHFSRMAEGPIPEEFKALQMTDYIGLSYNKLSGGMWDTSNHCFMHRIDLSHNSMSGTLSQDAFFAKSSVHLELMNLGFNQFSGNIPPCINKLETLSALLLNDNQFSGPLPDLSKLALLRHLNVANNQLSGAVGAWVGQLATLAILQLNGNKFTGPLPPTLPQALQRFHGGGNAFSGLVPMSYGDLPYLRYFECTGCQLTCPKPDLLAHLAYSTHCAG